MIDRSIDSDSGHVFIYHSELQTEVGVNDFPSEKAFDSDMIRSVIGNLGQ